MKCYFNLPENIKPLYKKEWFKQIKDGISKHSNYLNKVNSVEEAEIIFCLVEEVYQNYDKFKEDFDSRKKFIIAVAQRDNLNINYDIIKNHYVIAFLSCFKYQNDNPKNLTLLNVSSIYKSDFDKKPKLLKDRKYDVAFMGRITYDNPEITSHRTNILNKLSEICKKNNLKYIASEKLDKGQYLKTLNETKIFISPWGYGPWSLKDVECICKGVHVIVPKNNLISFPNFYENFDDFDNNLDLLEEKILHILKNINKAQIQVNKNRLLFESFEFKNQIILLDNYLIKYFENNK